MLAVDSAKISIPCPERACVCYAHAFVFTTSHLYGYLGYLGLVGIMPISLMNSKNVFLIPLFLLEIPEVYRSPGSSVRASVLNFWYWFSIFVTLLSKKLYTLFSFFYKLTYRTIPGWSAWFFFGATMLYSVNLSCIHELWTLFCTFVIKNAFRSGLLNSF